MPETILNYPNNVVNPQADALWDLADNGYLRHL